MLTAAADVRANGSFGERWLVVTDQRVVVLPGTGAGEDGYLAIPLADITEATTETLVSGGRLEVQQQGLPRSVLEYTSSQAPKFAEVARGIQQLAKGQPLAITDELPKLRCDKCGRLLPEKNGLCPKCVHRGAMALRLAGYLRPHWQQTVLLATLALTKTGVQLLPPVIQKTIIDGVLTPPVEGANTGGHYGDFGFLVLMVLSLGWRRPCHQRRRRRGWLVRRLLEHAHYRRRAERAVPQPGTAVTALPQQARKGRPHVRGDARHR